MTDLEDRLRTTLAAQADELPPSRHPRADLERRLAARRRSARLRPVVLTAAAAVVLVVGVAVPVLLARGDGDAGPRIADAPPTSAQVPPPSDPAPGDLLLAPVSIGEFTDLGQRWNAVVYAEHDAEGNQFCLVAMPTNAEPDSTAHHPASQGCEPIGPDTWPIPPADSLVATRTPLSVGIDSGPLPNLMVFVTAPQVTALEVRAGDGSPVDVAKLGATDSFTVYLATFDGSTQGFGYTAKDASGAVVEQAIT